MSSLEHWANEMAVHGDDCQHLVDDTLPNATSYDGCAAVGERNRAYNGSYVNAADLMMIWNGTRQLRLTGPTTKHLWRIFRDLWDDDVRWTKELGQRCYSWRQICRRGKGVTVQRLGS